MCVPLWAEWPRKYWTLQRYLTGGDTALGMLMNIGADGAEILAEILVGVPLVRVKGGAYEGLRLVTKAGAFGTEDAAAFAMRKIKERGGI